MPVGIGILSDLLLVAASREVLVYKLQPVLWSLFLSSPGLALLPMQLKGFLANKQGSKEGELQKVELEHLHKFCVALGAHQNNPRINPGSPLRWDCLTSPCSLLLLSDRKGWAAERTSLLPFGKGDEMTMENQG